MSAVSTYPIPFYKGKYFYRASLHDPKSPYQTSEPGTITNYRAYEVETITTSSSAGFEAKVSELDEIWNYTQDINTVGTGMILETQQSDYETSTLKKHFSPVFDLMDTWLNYMETIQHSSPYLINEGRQLEETFVDLFSILLEKSRVIPSDLTETFVKITENIYWAVSQTLEQIKQAIDLALVNGNHPMAANLVMQGLALFPEDTELQKIAKILAPSKVIRMDIPPAEGLGQSMKWLKENRQHYQGEWVAVQNGVLLGHTSSRAKLSEMLTGGEDSSRMIITKIPESLDLAI